MWARHNNLATLPPRAALPEETFEPPPGKHGKHHRRPLEARTNWDPWLPASEAYPSVPKVLHLAAMIMLAVLALLLLMTVMVSLAM
jgi:hypothetical protein